mmetsp:Transcript_21300/g.60674  ORF Transcript_21300/g.60674 Transcript_21300/m.60674 type:complete len:258 (+) Transcript_21300:483-1256(+)
MASPTARSSSAPAVSLCLFARPRTANSSLPASSFAVATAKTASSLSTPRLSLWWRPAPGCAFSRILRRTPTRLLISRWPSCSRSTTTGATSLTSTRETQASRSPIGSSCRRPKVGPCGPLAKRLRTPFLRRLEHTWCRRSKALLLALSKPRRKGFSTSKRRTSTSRYIRKLDRLLVPRGQVKRVPQSPRQLLLHLQWKRLTLPPLRTIQQARGQLKLSQQQQQQQQRAQRRRTFLPNLSRPPQSLLRPNKFRNSQTE